MPIKPVLSFLISFFLLVSSGAIAQGGKSSGETMRCGWWDNPTPGNVWLTDRDGEWTVGMQGGHQAKGNWPEFKDSQFVKTNGGHGHGCACLKVIDNPEEMTIVRIISARAVPASKCRGDRAIKNKEPK